MKHFALIAATFSAVLLAAPLGAAQTPPSTPPATEAPATPATAPTTPTAPATPSAAAEPPAASSHSCRTRKEVGEACACRSSPDQIGAVEAATDGGRNMCVVRLTPSAQ